jgi:uncharacterized protein with GYD domain
MPHYMIQEAYTAETMATLLKKPQNRLDAIRPFIEKMGGKVESAWLSFGEYDAVVICSLPDNVTAAAGAWAVGASGAIRATKTTPLLTGEEGIELMKKAAQAGYRPPAK